MKAKAFFIYALILLLGTFSAVAAQEITKNKDPKLKLPDLFIDHSEYDHVKPRVRFLVENKGNGESAPCTLKLVAVKAKSFMVIETVEYTHTVPALAAGARYANIFPLPETENGIATLPQKMVVDSTNVVKELNENNNEWSFVSEPVTRQMAEANRCRPASRSDRMPGSTCTDAKRRTAIPGELNVASAGYNELSTDYTKKLGESNELNNILKGYIGKYRPASPDYKTKGQLK